MKGKDEIKDLFSDKLGNFEAQVRPDLWTNIASQIGGTTSVASSGLSLLSKTFIGIGIGAAVVTTVILVSPKETIQKDKKDITTPVSISANNEEPPAVINGDVEQESKPFDVQIEAEKSEINPLPTLDYTKEIDQDQNFRGDVTLIDKKKEIVINEVSESKTTEQKEKQVVKETVDTDKKQINSSEKVEEKVVADIQPKTAYSIEKLPNVFTPDGDGANDVFSIQSDGLIDFTIVVFDANQNVVFESNNPGFKWDGSNKFGEKVKAGTYGYYIIAKDNLGNKVNKFSTLQIVL